MKVCLHDVWPRCLVQVEMYEGELKALKQAGAGAFFQTMTLPEGMSVTSSDIIASLNEHLILVLQVGKV